MLDDFIAFVAPVCGVKIEGGAEIEEVPVRKKWIAKRLSAYCWTMFT